VVRFCDHFLTVSGVKPTIGESSFAQTFPKYRLPFSRSCPGVTGSSDQSAAFTFSRDTNRQMNQSSQLSGRFAARYFATILEEPKPRNAKPA
jgi:hypothetical protein